MQMIPENLKRDSVDSLCPALFNHIRILYNLVMEVSHQQSNAEW